MNGTYRLDLHNHTPHVAADYRSPDATAATLVEAAMAARIDVLGATDHFSVGFCRSLIDAAAAHANGRTLLVLPGAEIKVRHAADEAHLVALFDPDSAFESAFEELMRRLGLTAEELRAPLLPHVSVLADPVEVARTVAALGGTCHVGHADRAFGDYTLLGTSLLRRLCAEPCVNAVELLDLASAEIEPALAETTLIRSSDAHCPTQIGRRFSELPLRELTFAGVRDARRQPQRVVNAS